MLQRMERAWRYVLARLWGDRLAYQYEAGYGAGLREGIKNGWAYAECTEEEIDALCNPPTDGIPIGAKPV